MEPYIHVSYQVSDGVYDTKTFAAGETAPGPFTFIALQAGDFNEDGMNDIVAFNNYNFSKNKLLFCSRKGQLSNLL